MNKITVCKDCVAPNRHTGCHGSCYEYLEEVRIENEKKAAYIAQKYGNRRTAPRTCYHNKMFKSTKRLVYIQD